jgi:hypothetical protein
MKEKSMGGGKMIRLAILALAIGVQTGWAGGLVGRPAFCVGDKGTAMTLEFSNMRYSVKSAGVAEASQVETQRGLLRATFGVARGTDIDLAVGTANLVFPDSPDGYSTFRSDWSFAWGGGFRFGYPFEKEPWQVQLSASYIGFRADGKTSNPQKMIESQYTWQEFTPMLTGGYRIGQFTPYIGVMQPFLFGVRETTVEFLGTVRPALGGKQSYSDGNQKAQALLGVDWLFPNGYSATVQASIGGKDAWGFTLGLAQTLK